MGGNWRDPSLARGYDPNMLTQPHGSRNVGANPQVMSMQPRFPMGSQIPQEETFLEDYYVYLSSFGNIATTASATANIQVQADASFEWLMSTCSGNLNGVTQPASDASIIPVTVQIIDTGAGRSLSSAGVPINMIAGTGKQPYILPISRIFQANATIQVTATNYGADTWNNLYLAFIGRKIWNVQINGPRR